MNLMKFFGFDGEDDDYDEGEEYTQEERRKPSRSRREGSRSPALIEPSMMESRRYSNNCVYRLDSELCFKSMNTAFIAE